MGMIDYVILQIILLLTGMYIGGTLAEAAMFAMVMVWVIVFIQAIIERL